MSKRPPSTGSFAIALATAWFIVLAVTTCTEDLGPPAALREGAPK